MLSFFRSQATEPSGAQPKPSTSSPPSTPQTQAQPTAAPEPTPAVDSSASPLARSLRQFSLLFAGAGFLAASVAVSRRSVLRRRLDALPAFHTSNRNPTQFDSSDRSLLAAQALGLATLNVSSFAVMLVGGLSWAFDISSLPELRQRTQAALHRDAGTGALDREEEKELEDMMNALMEKLGMDTTNQGTDGAAAAAAATTTTTTTTKSTAREQSLDKR